MASSLTRTLSSLALLAFGLMLGATPAAAHAVLGEAEPAPGEVLDTPPTEVVLVFDGELDPETSGFVVTDAEGIEVGEGGVDLEVAERDRLRGPVDAGTPGSYTVTWSVTSHDGHAVEGTHQFSVRGESAGEDDEPESPDTALPPRTAPSSAIGLALIVGAGALAWQRAARRVRVRR